MPPKKTQKRMPAAKDRQARPTSPESENGSVAETQEDTGGEATKEATMEAIQEASEECKRIDAVFDKEDELKLVEFLKDNELLYNKTL